MVFWHAGALDSFILFDLSSFEIFFRFFFFLFFFIFLIHLNLYINRLPRGGEFFVA